MTERPGQTAALDTEDQLRARVADYEARLDEIAELIARVRRDINNPLTGVLGQSQLLLREDLNEKARKRAQTIEVLAIRIRDIVAQLREVQRPPDNTGPDAKSDAERIVHRGPTSLFDLDDCLPVHKDVIAFPSRDECVFAPLETM